MVRGEKEKRRWHVGRVIDAPMLFALLVQTSGVIWYGAQLVKTVELQGQQISGLSTRLDKLVEAQRDSIAPNAVLAARMAMIEQEIAMMRRRIYR